LVIADILRGVQKSQEEQVKQAVAVGKKPTPVVVIIEESHEFLSAQRVKQMPVLFEQVAKLAKRGRKRWLGLVFVTQLPQHLSDEVLGLINNFISHKISDGGVVDRLKKSISGIDRSQWAMLPGLAPGQAPSIPHRLVSALLSNNSFCWRCESNKKRLLRLQNLLSLKCFFSPSSDFGMTGCGNRFASVCVYRG
jgi:DNA helicase HerA-like ATPase